MKFSQKKLHFWSPLYVFCLFAVSIQLTIPTKAQIPIEEITLLEPNKNFERELAGGQKHSYKIKAEANEFLQVKVEQRGIDAVIKLFDNNDKQLAEVDSPGGTVGEEVLFFIIPDAGFYRIEVSSLESNAAQGNYAIFREIPRSATEKDKIGIEANRFYAEGNLLASQGTVEGFQNALLKFEKALQLYKKGEFKTDEAFTLLILGNIYNSLNQKQKAVEFFSSTHQKMKEVGDQQGEALALNNLALTLADLGENQKALKYFEEILPLFRQISDKKGEATALNNIGAIYENTGDLDSAMKFYLQAMPIYTELRDERNTATTLNNLGLIYMKKGERQKALDNYNQALKISRTLGDIGGIVVTLNNIAQVYSRIGEKQKALEYFDQVLKLIKQTGNKHSEAITLNNIGVIYSELGEKQKSLEYLSQAVDIFGSLGLKQAEATLLSNIGGIYNDLNNFEKAIIFYEKSLQILKTIGDKRGEAKTLNNIGKVFTELRSKDKALEYYTASLKLAETYFDPELEAKTLNNLGILFQFSFNDNQKARDYFIRAIPLHQIVGDRNGAANTLTNLMYVWDLSGNRRLAILYGKQAVNMYQSLRGDIRDLEKDLQKSFLGTVDESYRKLAELLVKEKRESEAERVLRMLKEEEYFEFVSRDGKIVSSLDERINLSPAEKQAADQFEKLTFEIEQFGKDFGELERQKSDASAEQIKIISGKQAEINKSLENSSVKLKTFLDELNINFSRNEVGEKNTEDSSQAIVKEWNAPHTAVISTIVGENNLSLIVTTANFQRGYVIPVSAIRLNELVRQFRAKVLDPTSDPKPAAQELYNVLIKPIERDLETAKIKTIVWSLDKFLRYAPISALWDKKNGYSVQNFSNVILALASRENLALRPVGKKNWKVLGVGVSKKIEGFSSLSYSKEQLNRIVRDTSLANDETEIGMIEGRRFLNENFNMDNFRKNLGSYPFTHASTHFKFIHGTKAEGLKSFLLLGSGERFTMEDIQKADNIFKGIELLTLSACETAYGEKTADGREIEGFGVMAQRKGARAIMATLWSVDQSSTMNLMVNFYDYYQKDGVSKAEALRQAQLSLLRVSDKLKKDFIKPKINPDRNFSHPYYWSGFVLIGNWW